MAIQKKSLISNRATVKKAVLASNATETKKVTGKFSPSPQAKFSPRHTAQLVAAKVGKTFKP